MLLPIAIKLELMKSVLLDYAKDCNQNDYFQGVVYDRNLSMSVIKNGNHCIPFIESSSVNMSVLTKTEAARERDDSFPMSLAIETKTFSNREADDQGPFNN